MSTPRTERNPSCVVWWLWQETGRCDSWELTFAETLVCSKADLRQVENEATAIKNDVLGLSLLLCSKTRKHNLSTDPGRSSEHFVFHISLAELQHNLHRSRCPLYISHTIKFPICKTGKVSPDLGAGCGHKNGLAGYPTISLLWMYQWELAEDPFQSRQARVSMRPILFSCEVDLSRRGL